MVRYIGTNIGTTPLDLEVCNVPPKAREHGVLVASKECKTIN